MISNLSPYRLSFCWLHSKNLYISDECILTKTCQWPYECVLAMFGVSINSLSFRTAASPGTALARRPLNSCSVALLSRKQAEGSDSWTPSDNLFEGKNRSWRSWTGLISVCLNGCCHIRLLMMLLFGPLAENLFHRCTLERKSSILQLYFGY